MVKKAKSKVQSKDDNQLAAAIRDSAQQIWLAGMGAFAKAREERTKIFEALVKEGRSIQLRTRALAEERIGEVTDKVNDVSKRASESWDKLEQVFENRVQRSLTKLGVPTSKDIKALIKRVDDLTATVQKMGGAVPAGKATRKPAPRKAAGGPARKAARAAAKRVATKSPAKAAAKSPAKAPAKPAAAARPAAPEKPATPAASE